MPEVADLSKAARETSVVVVGGGIAGLVAAYECARVGMPVTVLESSGRLGGAVGSVTLGGVEVPTGAIAFQAGEALDKLIEALAADESDFVPERIAQAKANRTTTTSHGVRELPAGVLGIPENPFDARAVAIIGWSGAWRAYVDRLRPPLTIGHQDNLDKLVRSRMGKKVADRLVAPVVRAEFGLDATEVDLAVAAPTLNPALTRLGSLSGAVSELLATDESTWQTLDGTLTVLVAALAQRIAELGGTIITDATVEKLEKESDGVHVTYAADEQTSLTADVVFVAAPEDPARELLGGVLKLPKLHVSQASERMATITAVVTPNADNIGAGLSPSPAESSAESLDNLTTAWGLQSADGHLVRLRLPVEPEYDEDTVLAQGVAEIERLVSGSVAEAHLEVFSRVPHAEMARFLTTSAPLRTKKVRTGAVIPVGAWVSGTGLDRVVADTQEAVETVRRRVLFG